MGKRKRQQTKSPGANEAYEYEATLSRVPWKSLTLREDVRVACPHGQYQMEELHLVLHIQTGIRRDPCRCDWALEGEAARVF